MNAHMKACMEAARIDEDQYCEVMVQLTCICDQIITRRALFPRGASLDEMRGVEGALKAMVNRDKSVHCGGDADVTSLTDYKQGRLK